MSFQMGGRPFNAIEKMSDGIRAYFGKVYNYMAGGLALSGLVAYVTVHSSLINLFYRQTPQGLTYSLLGWVAIFSPLISFTIAFILNPLLPTQAPTTSKFGFLL